MQLFMQNLLVCKYNFADKIKTCYIIYMRDAFVSYIFHEHDTFCAASINNNCQISNNVWRCFVFAFHDSFI